MLLTHECPAGVGTTREKREAGQPAIRQLVEAIQPDVQACGHIHYDHRSTIGRTEVVCLGRPGPGPTGIAAFRHQPGGGVVSERPLNA